MPGAACGPPESLGRHVPVFRKRRHRHAGSCRLNPIPVVSRGVSSWRSLLASNAMNMQAPPPEVASWPGEPLSLLAASWPFTSPTWPLRPAAAPGPRPVCRGPALAGTQGVRPGDRAAVPRVEPCADVLPRCPYLAPPGSRSECLRLAPAVYPIDIALAAVERPNGPRSGCALGRVRGRAAAVSSTASVPRCELSLSRLDYIHLPAVPLVPASAAART